MSNLMNDLHISNNGGTATVTRNVPTGDVDPSMAGNRPRFDQVDGSQTLTVGPQHELYDTPTTMSFNVANDPDLHPDDGFVTKQGGTVQGDMTDEKNTLFRLNGMEFDIPTAMKQGLVAKTANGLELTDKAKSVMGAKRQQQAAAGSGRQAGEATGGHPHCRHPRPFSPAGPAAPCCR